MDKVEIIEKILLDYSVSKYKIIEKNLFKIQYKDISETINFDETKLGTLYISFNINDKCFKLTVNKSLSEQDIETLLSKSLGLYKTKTEGTFNLINRTKNTYKKTANDIKLYTNEFCSKIVKENAKIIFKSIDFKANASYGMEVYNYKMLANGKIYNQQFIHSDYFFYKLDDPSVNAYISLNNDLRISSTDLIFKQFDINKLPQKTIDLSKNILFKSTVVAELLNSYISCFYADNIYANNSLIKKREILSKKFNFKFDLISTPFEGIIFDSDGFFTKDIYLIKDNKLKNILSNEYFSKILNIENTGNAVFFDSNSIAYQNIKVIPRCYIRDFKYQFIVDYIKILSFDTATSNLSAQIIFSENGNKYQSNLNVNLNYVLEHSFFEEHLHKNNGILCGNMLFVASNNYTDRQVLKDNKSNF